MPNRCVCPSEVWRGGHALFMSLVSDMRELNSVMGVLETAIGDRGLVGTLKILTGGEGIFGRVVLD